VTTNSLNVAEATRLTKDELRDRVSSEFAIIHASDSSPAEVETAREELIRLHQPLVGHLARRFSDRGEPHEDLMQVGMLGLVKAIDRFEPERGLEFVTYAVPTVLGEIKRYFRDHAWAMRVPRRVQEIRLSLSSAVEDLTQELQRAPSVDEIASRVGAGRDDILEAFEASNAYQTVPLDPAADPEETMPSLVDQLGVDDPGLIGVERREVLRPMLQELPERERLILELRFIHQHTQSQIASEVGISQMHVSRILTRTLASLREQFRDGTTVHDEEFSEDST
jgi:RNA polymerase sigma-B factor